MEVAAVEFTHQTEHTDTLASISMLRSVTCITMNKAEASNRTMATICLMLVFS